MQSSAPSAKLGIASAAAGALLWGFSGVCLQFLTAEYGVSSLFATMVRSLVAAVLFLAAIAAHDRRTLLLILSDRRLLAQHAVFGLGLFGSQFFYALSIALTNAGTATILQMSSTVFVLVYTAFAARAFPSARELAGLLCALGGVWLIVTHGNPTALVLPAAGLAIGLLNGISTAVYVAYPKRLLATFGSFTSTGIAMAFNAVLSSLLWAGSQALSPAGMHTASPLPALDAFGALVLIGGVAVLGTFVAFWLYVNGIRHAGPVTGSILGALEPLSALLVGSWWMGNPIAPADWIGFVLMVAMVVLVSLPKRTSCTSAKYSS